MFSGRMQISKMHLAGVEAQDTAGHCCQLWPRFHIPVAQVDIAAEIVQIAVANRLGCR